MKDSEILIYCAKESPDDFPGLILSMISPSAGLPSVSFMVELHGKKPNEELWNEIVERIKYMFMETESQQTALKSKFCKMIGKE